MTRFSLAAAGLLALLAGCGFRGPATPQIGPDGQPLPVAYRISARDNAEIANRILSQVNLLRAQSGAEPLTISPQLNAAGAAHARDMSAQNRAWHFGSDGSSPLDRVQRQGYTGHLIGENISETYENDIATLAAWMRERDTRDVLMDPAGRNMGMGWYQEPGNKIWWVVLVGN